MANQTLTISGRLPGYNDLKGGHWAACQRKKQEAMDIVIYSMMQQKIRPSPEKVQIIITCYEPNLKRDKDNILAGACKIILDAMQQAKIIKGDGQKYIELVTDTKLDRVNARIEVEIREIESISSAAHDE